LFQGKPTHRIIRETNDEDEGRINRIKEFLGQIYGGSTSQSSPYQPQSSTSNQPDSLTSPLVETPAGPESN